MRVRSSIHPAVLSASRLGLGRLHGFAVLLNGLVLAIVLAALFTVATSQTSMQPGTVAGETIVAQHKVSYTDKEATAARKRQVMLAVPAVYILDTRALGKREHEANAFLSKASPVIAAALSPGAKLITLRKLLPADVSPEALQEFASLQPADYPLVQARSLALLAQAEAWHFDDNQVPATEIGLLSTVSPHVTVLQRAAIGEILSTFLVPTLTTDASATLQRQRLAAARIKPVTRTIFPGQVVVRRGEMVTAAVMAKLVALGLQRHQSGWQETAGSLIFSILVVTMLFWYLTSFYRGAAMNMRILLFIDAAVLATVVGARLLGPSHVLLPFFLPVAAAPTFAAVLIAPEAAIAIGFTLAILAGWITANSFELTIYYFLTSAAGVLAVRNVRQLKQFILAGVYISVFGLLTILAFGLVDHNYDLVAIQDFTLAAAFNGFVSSSLALGGFAVLAQYFGVTTSLQLLELGQPSRPLLRRLTVKAPGTYNHSLIVASMVERAAEEIDADSLTAKLGALYHDVGKTVNPHCFVENQLGMGNIHDELRPDESVRLIRSHVVHGLRLARQHGLPRSVLDAIAEHHGTMAISYFLHRAQEYSDGPLDMTLYTYPGPKPQSKETALIMLADGCESAVRASGDHSGTKIEEIVDAIFRERITQGQLSESPLTLGDLERVRAAFLSVLNGLYHPRIEYPEAALQPEVSRPVERGIAT